MAEDYISHGPGSSLISGANNTISVGYIFGHTSKRYVLISLFLTFSKLFFFLHLSIFSPEHEGTKSACQHHNADTRTICFL